MSSYFKEFASDSVQPKEFSFTAENLREAKVVLKDILRIIRRVL